MYSRSVQFKKELQQSFAKDPATFMSLLESSIEIYHHNKLIEELVSSSIARLTAVALDNLEADENLEKAYKELIDQALEIADLKNFTVN